MGILSKMFYKELRWNRKYLLFCALFITAYSVYMGWRIDSSRLFVTFSAATAALFAMTMNARSDRFRGDVLNCSLPLDRRDVVLGKYVSTLTLTLVFFVCGFAAAVISPATKVFSGASLTPAAWLQTALLVSVLVSFFNPFIVRFGFMGVMYLLIGFQVLGLANLILSTLKGAPLVGLRRLASSIRSFFSWASARFGQFGYIIFLIIISLALLALSYLFSVFLFKRKDL